MTERLIPPRGEILTPLAEDEVREAARALKAAGITSIAICLLFSYLDPMHERRARALVLEEHPEAFVTLSSDVAPQFREFERFTTAAMISDRPVVTMLSGPAAGALGGIWAGG